MRKRESYSEVEIESEGVRLRVKSYGQVLDDMDRRLDRNTIMSFLKTITWLIIWFIDLWK